MNQPPPLTNPNAAGPHYQRMPETSGAAIGSLITGILSPVCCWCVSGIPAVICGHIALANISKDPDNLKGKGMAIAGLIMGYIGILFSVLYTAFIALNPEIHQEFMKGFQEELKRQQETQTQEVLPLEEAEFEVILPDNHDPAQPLPVAIWLHGYGATPSELTYDEAAYQELANKRDIAFAAISAPALYDEEDFGDGTKLRSYEWTEGIDSDGRHIEQVLLANKDKVSPASGKILLFGFSQGAKVAGDIASTNPDTYAGAFLISPGGMSDPKPATVAVDAHRNQAYSIVVGDGEHHSNQSMATAYRNAFRSLGADTWHRETKDQADHTTPEDFFPLIESWLDRAL